MSTQVQNGVPGLSINQRNLYLYYLNHRKKHPNTPCYVPKNMAQGNGKADYFRALEKLEKLRLVRVDRTAENYTGWILLEP